MNKIYFTPGPTEIHPLVKAALKEALDSGIASISHRSADFEKISAACQQELRKLMSVPPDYEIFFLASGSEAWERVIQGCVEKKSFHFVNGAFSTRFKEISVELGKQAEYVEKPAGHGFCAEDIPQSSDAELLCLTINETSTGVCLDEGLFQEVRNRHPDKLIAVDAVSAAPIPNLNLSLLDAYFFSVQKFFCLPAGLGVLIVSPQALEKARSLRDKGFSVGCYHSLLNLESFAEKNQTPATPNVLGIYSLARIAEFFNKEGIDKIRAETSKKADLIYDFLDASKNLKAFVIQPGWRSRTVVTVNSGSRTKEVLEKLILQGLIVGEGYSKLRESQFRIANFSAHGFEQMQRLISVLSGF